MSGPHAQPAPDSAGAQAAEALVRRFLAAMEARDLQAARACLAPGFTMRFPATPPMTELDQLIAWAAPRYRSVTKAYDGFDVVPGAPETVYCRGTLAGEWHDGTRFDGIRFIDRFEISAGLLIRQDVWNDMAETRARA
ncbi:MAG: nuclear transport factor 2 family protein [Rhodobacteraceae bacterium]|nr:nuclear transport factor 2 family protein [Paracoccaceae bacterium]